MKIGLDLMGGDFAPEATFEGALQALKELPSEVRLVLIGDEKRLQKMLTGKEADSGQFDFVQADDIIEMGEHPAKAFAAKPKSSISIGFQLLKSGKIDGFSSAGNTGAILVGIHYTIRTLNGIIRPAIATFLPAGEKDLTLLLDAGLNPDSKPDVLYQYAIMGSVYAKSVWGLDNPRIGLLNIGSEESKGNLIARSTYELMKDNTDFNFVGNFEANEFFSNKRADVVVCDGFVGNVILKEAEAFYKLSKQRNFTDPYFERFNFENYGGSPILGASYVVVIGHGISNAKAIKNMILQTRNMVEADLINKIKKAIK